MSVINSGRACTGDVAVVFVYDEPYRRAAVVDEQAVEQDEEDEEVLVVVLADAVAHPWTVVVELLDAVVALATVGHTGWSEDVARVAELHVVFAASNERELVLLVQEHVIIVNHSFLVSRQHTRITTTTHHTEHTRAYIEYAFN